MAGLTLVLALAFIAPAAAAETATAAATAAVNDPGRPPWDIEHDGQRKPAEALAFSGIKAGDKVADLAPGDGYYTRILAKMVGPKGHVYPVVPLANPLNQKAPGPRPVDALLAIQDIAEYSNVTVYWEQLYDFGGQFSVPERLDAVWSFGSYHGLHARGLAVPANAYQGLDMIAVNKAIFATLKPGGVYVIEDAGTALGMGFGQAAKGQRIDANAVKAEVLDAGFVLDGESKILANPADDHTKPADDASLQGNPDRFLLRFKKPANATAHFTPPPGAMDGYFGNTSHSGVHSDTQRWVFFHPDGTYQEFGNSGTRAQEGTWYWDGVGHNCMLHQFPAEEQGLIVCHDFTGSVGVKVGDTWTRVTAGRIFRMEKGYNYPPAKLSFD